MSNKILLTANTAWYLYNFRLPLARALLQHGTLPVFVSPYDPYADKLQNEGFRWIELKMNRNRMNPFLELRTILRIAWIYFREKPQAVHHFTIKCILYGTIASRLAGVPSVINALTGLGHIFVDSSLKIRLARPLVKFFYKLILNSSNSWVIFQNPDDLDSFRNSGLLYSDRFSLIKSSGVNTNRFSPDFAHDDNTTVLFASRLLAEKGIHEFIDAARILKSRGIKADFLVAGSPDFGNPSSVSLNELELWETEGLVKIQGHVETIETVLGSAALVVLPSYREGVPKILLEAASMGKALVSTDVPGCREAVEHGKNGLLVQPRDAYALADAIEILLKNSDLRLSMGIAGRQKVLTEFDEKIVLNSTIQIYRTLQIL